MGGPARGPGRGDGARPHCLHDGCAASGHPARQPASGSHFSAVATQMGVHTHSACSSKALEVCSWASSSAGPALGCKLAGAAVPTGHKCAPAPLHLPPTLPAPACLPAGEDVGHYGGSYKVSSGLYKKYGDMRLLDTPICENGFMGMGVGAAMTGLRPIVEGMNMGFLLLAFNQISNNCGMLHYTSGGQYKVPMVIRGPGGVGRQLGAEHSQRLESYFQSIPGGGVAGWVGGGRPAGRVSGWVRGWVHRRAGGTPGGSRAAAKAVWQHAAHQCVCWLRVVRRQAGRPPAAAAAACCSALYCHGPLAISRPGSLAPPCLPPASLPLCRRAACGRVHRGQQQGPAEERHPQRQPNHLLRARAAVQRQGCAVPPRHCRLLSYSCCAAPVACCTAACCAGPAALCCGCASDSISSTSAVLCLARPAQRHPAFCSRFFSGVLPARQCALYGLPFRSLLLLTPPPLPSLHNRCRRGALWGLLPEPGARRAGA